MAPLLLTIALCSCGPAPARAASEQEVADAFVGRLRTATADSEDEWALSDLRLEALLRLAGDRRTLQLQIARKQLAADLASAAVDLAAAPGGAAQARGGYTQAVSAALGQYQQAVGAAYNQWAQDCGAAYNRAQQDSGASLNALQQALSAASQGFASGMQDPALAEMPPLIEPVMPDLTAAGALGPEQLPGVEKSLNDARASCRNDLAQALAACDPELQDAIVMAAGPDRATAVRKVIAKLKLSCLDRQDQYEAEVRAILRKALLGAEG